MTPGTAVVRRGLGLATCYDLRFPEHVPPAARRRRRDRADAGGLAGQAGRALAAARAGAGGREPVYVVACNTAGKHAGCGWAADAGRRPVGRVLAEAGDGEEVLVADLDLEVPRTRAPSSRSYASL